jgi:hypothetical protein
MRNAEDNLASSIDSRSHRSSLVPVRRVTVADCTETANAPSDAAVSCKPREKIKQRAILKNYDCSIGILRIMAPATA